MVLENDLVQKARTIQGVGHMESRDSPAADILVAAHRGQSADLAEEGSLHIRKESAEGILEADPYPAAHIMGVGVKVVRDVRRPTGRRVVEHSAVRSQHQSTDIDHITQSKGSTISEGRQRNFPHGFGHSECYPYIRKVSS